MWPDKGCDCIKLEEMRSASVPGSYGPLFIFSDTPSEAKPIKMVCFQTFLKWFLVLPKMLNIWSLSSCTLHTSFSGPPHFWRSRSQSFKTDHCFRPLITPSCFNPNGKLKVQQRGWFTFACSQPSGYYSQSGCNRIASLFTTTKLPQLNLC